MAKTLVKIDDEVAAVLKQCTFEGFNLYLPILERDLYKRVDTVLRLAGACWDRTQPKGPSGLKGAHVVTSSDIAEKLGLALERGEIVHTKNLHQQFFTPANVAENIVTDALAELEANGAFQEAAAMGTAAPLRFMDPSAGNGRFLDALTQWFTGGGGIADIPAWLALRGIEIDASLATELKRKGYAVMCRDFLQVQPKPTTLCDYIFMNPPFTAGQDMKHVMHAFSFLKPGGKLTAIMGCTVLEGNTKLHREFAEFYQAWGIIVDELPAGTFKESGTMVRTTVFQFIHPDF